MWLCGAPWRASKKVLVSKFEFFGPLNPQITMSHGYKIHNMEIQLLVLILPPGKMVKIDFPRPVAPPSVHRRKFSLANSNFSDSRAPKYPCLMDIKSIVWKSNY